MFSRASWVLLPYVSFHSQSGVLADAYTYRVPLVVTDVGAIGPTVRSDGTGFVVPPGEGEEHVVEIGGMERELDHLDVGLVEYAQDVAKGGEVAVGGDLQDEGVAVA